MNTIQFNLWGGLAEEPHVFVGRVKCTPKRIDGKIRLITPTGWVLPERQEDIIFKPLKNGGMIFAFPSEILEVVEK